MALSGAIPLAASATTNLFAAREQMAFTLGFHIVLACLGVALPATILVANWIGLKKDDHDAMELAQRWSKAMARPTYSAEWTTAAGPLPSADQAASTRSVRTNPGCSPIEVIFVLRRSPAIARLSRSEAALNMSYAAWPR